MRTNLKIILLVAGMSLVMFVGLFLYHVYRFKGNYKREFLNEKAVFGAQVANIALSGLQASNYFELSRLGTGLFEKKTMLYLAIIDENGQRVHFSTEWDLDQLEAFRTGVPPGNILEEAKVGGKDVALIRSEVRDEAGKLWGTIEICYYWEAVYRIFRDQLSGTLVFFLVFIPAWSAVFLYNTKGLLRPLDQFVANLEKIGTEWPIPVSEFESRLVPAKAGPELTVLLNVLKTSLFKLISVQEAHDREAQFSALGKQAAQVAHDIRSPLAALDSISKDISELQEDKSLVLRSAVGRIHDIANDLIERNRQMPKRHEREGAAVQPASGAASAQRLSVLIEPVIAEKRLQFRSMTGVEISAKFEKDSQGLFAKAQPAEFKRVLSNLMNNAVEALDGKGGVRVSLSGSGDKISVAIKDTGKGIPAEFLPRLGNRGETHGKRGGSGLGLYHAKATVESWGGTLAIRSEAGKGTEVELLLPRAEKPGGLVPVDIGSGGGPGVSAPKAAVLIDDDPLVRMNWRTAAKSGGVALRDFASAEEFFSAGVADKLTPVYIDSDLGGGIKGEDIAVRLKAEGFTEICLETGYTAEQFGHIPWLKVSGKEPPWA